jgi:mitochondrial-processing peptidase subunit alpha
MIKNIRKFIHNSYVPLPDHSPIYIKDIPSLLQKSKLENGIKIITETAKFPNCINLAIVIKLGTRDDPLGHLDIYKELFLKSRGKNDQHQYSILELCGSEVSILLERENIYIHTSCLEEHLSHVIQALSHTIFYEVTERSTREAVDRFNSSLVPETAEENFKNMFVPSAYSNLTLGIRYPRASECSITAESLASYLQSYLTGERLTISACGIKDHERFVELAYKSFHKVPVSKLDKTVKSAYTGGLARQSILGDMSYVTLGFQGCSFDDPDMPAFVVLRAIIGEGGGFSTGGPGKGMHSRAYTKILPYGFLESVKGINFNFTDSGVFGISLVGLEKYASYMPDLILKEIADLLNVTDEELNRAKNIITREALIGYQKTQGRIEDIAKNCAFFFKTPDEFQYLQKINNVNIDNIKKVVIRLLRSNFTLNVISDDKTSIPTIQELYKRLGRQK